MNKIFILLLIYISFFLHTEEDPFNAFIYISPLNSDSLVNIGIKDNIDVKGMITSAGSLALSSHYPNKDAFLISKLKSSNYHIYGKTNLSEWANFRSFNSKEIKKKDFILGANKIDYVENYNINNFKKAKKGNENFNIFIAYYIGNVRLIDNI